MNKPLGDPPPEFTEKQKDIFNRIRRSSSDILESDRGIVMVYAILLAKASEGKLSDEETAQLFSYGEALGIEKII